MPEYTNTKLRIAPAPPTAVERHERAYAELDVTTNFSFLRGASHPDELVFRATELGYRAIAITDVNSLAGVVRAFDAVRQVKDQAGTPPRLLIGSRLCFSDFPDLLVYATDRPAYARLCRLLTLGKRRSEKGGCDLKLDDFLNSNEGLLAAVTTYPPAAIANQQSQIKDLRDALGDRLSLAAAILYGHDDESSLSHLITLSRSLHVPLLATNHVHYHLPQRRMLQDVLTCVRHGCTVSAAGFKLFPNGERYLKSPTQMHRLFAAHPQAIRRALDVAERCTFSLDQLRYEYPDELVPPDESPIAHLAELTWRGAADRYPNGVPDKVRHQIDHELKLIAQLGFEAYFLTVHDLVRFARSRGILCQGRGSAANSAVCYCIGVTSVDPNRTDVLFERFISSARGEPPDIDVDFEHERREEVIQYVYEKYGRDRAGMTAEVISYRGRSAIRDVGKALGLSLDLVDQMAKKLDWWHRGSLDDSHLHELGLDPTDRTVKTVIALSSELLGFPRHLSQHVGGLVMTRTPLCELVPIENASMPGRTVIEWDKDDIDTLGILKVDVLALGMLTCISKAFQLLNGRHGGTEARRHEGGNYTSSERRDHREPDSHVSGPHRVEAWDEAGEGDVPDHQTDAEGRVVRPDEPDAASSNFGPIQHRGRLRPRNDEGLPEASQNFPRLAGRTLDSIRTGHRARNAPDGSSCLVTSGGSRSGPPGTDPQRQASQTTNPLTTPSSPSSPSCLRASVPSCLNLELHTIPPEDPAVYEMISDADTIGVFQIESRAQMSMLPRLRPRNFHDLVIEVAIVRPGPIQGNMVHPYLRRRNGEEPVAYPSAALRQVLEKTLGVPLFQEQAMRVAMVGAGFTAEEADRLRRAMAAWRKSGAIDAFHKKFVEGMLANGYTRAFADQCFTQIRGFGEYGFPESHAASFALLVYVSAWIKRYHPAAFCAALLNSQPMGFYAPAQIVRDAEEHGVPVLPVDVNYSDWDCTLESQPSAPGPAAGKSEWGRGGPAVRIGLRMVKGLRRADAQLLTDARRETGVFTSIERFRKAARFSQRALEQLADADAFSSLGLSRRESLWSSLAAGANGSGSGAHSLFDGLEPAETEPALALPPMPVSEEVAADYAATGLSLKDHPVALVRSELKEMGVITSEQLKRIDRGRQVRVAGLVLVRQRPGTASGIVFATLEDEAGVVNLIIRPKVYDRYRAAARQAILLRADGYVERQGQVIHLLVLRLHDLSPLLPGLSHPSRNFH